MCIHFSSNESVRILSIRLLIDIKEGTYIPIFRKWFGAVLISSCLFVDALLGLFRVYYFQQIIWKLHFSIANYSKVCLQESSIISVKLYVFSALCDSRYCMFSFCTVFLASSVWVCLTWTISPILTPFFLLPGYLSPIWWKSCSSSSSHHLSIEASIKTRVICCSNAFYRVCHAWEWSTSSSWDPMFPVTVHHRSVAHM